MQTSKNSKPWFKKWWGVVFTIAFFYIAVPYLVWTQTKWDKRIKIGITIVCGAILIFMIADIEKDRSEAQELFAQAEKLVAENNLEAAQKKLDDSKKLNSNKQNPAFVLAKQIEDLESENFLKESLVEMSDEDFELLQKNELQKNFIENEKLNQLFLEKLRENSEKRASFIAEIEAARAAKAQQEKTEARKKEIEEHFSPWNGSHIEFTRLIKASMNDPDSFEHVETRYTDFGDHLVVVTTFRGRNAFGGLVLDSAKAKVALDGTVLEILD